MTAPTVQVSAFSGLRSRLPPVNWLYWSAGLPWMLPYWAAVTPVFAHWAAVNTGVAPAHGSVPDHSPSDVGEKSSRMFGARTARLKPPRIFTSRIGEYSPMIL